MPGARRGCCSSTQHRCATASRRRDRRHRLRHPPMSARLSRCGSRSFWALGRRGRPCSSLLWGINNSSDGSSSQSPRAPRTVHKRECEGARTRRSRPGCSDPWLPDSLARPPQGPPTVSAPGPRSWAWTSSTTASKADAEEIRDTAVAQPLLVAAGLLSAAALGDIAPDAVAGHSVGEITAAAFAGSWTTRPRSAWCAPAGLAMAEAAAVTRTGMSALLGGSPETTVPHLRSWA